MADRIRGITIEIGGDTTGLSKALSSVNKEIKSTQAQLKDVDKLLKLDPKNVTLLEQKQRLLAQAIAETKQKLDTLKQAEAQAQQQFAKGEISQQQYDALQREIIATEQQLRSLEKAAEQSNAKIQHLAAATKEISQQTAEFADKTRALSAAGAAVVAALGGMAMKAITSSDDLNTLAKQTGFSTAELQKMQYAADRVDVSMETITGSAAKLKRNMSSTSTTVAAAFSRLGVSVRGTNGELRDSTTVFWEVVSALGEVENETERDALAMQLFGKSADELAGIVDDGGASLRQLGKEAEDLGLILSQDTLDGLNEVNDRIDTLKARIQGVISVNGAKVVEAFLPLIEELADGAGDLAEKIASLDTNIIKNIATVAAVVAGISPVAGIISKITGAAANLMTVLPGLFTLVAAHPFGAAAIGVTALVTALVAWGKANADLPDTVDSLTKSAQSLDKVIEEASKDFDTNTTAIYKNWEKGKLLLERLSELESQTSRTAAEEYERSQIVEQLNGLYPDLNLNIDENTGKLSSNVDVIRQQIAALRDAAVQQAAQAKYQTILEAMAEAQLEVYENQVALREATNNYNDAAARAESLITQLAAANEKLANTSIKDAEAYNAAVEAVRDLETAYGMANGEAQAWAAEVDKLTEAIRVGEEAVQSYADEYESAVTGLASVMSGAGYNAGSAYGEGLARGIESKRGRVAAAAGGVAKGAVDRGNYVMQIASPSKVARQQGIYWDEGLIAGLNAKRENVADASQEVAESIMQSGSVTNNNVVNNNSSTSNLGGVYVTVNAAPGQDVQQLAEAVMEEIQAAVEREGAAL